MKLYVQTSNTCFLIETVYGSIQPDMFCSCVVSSRTCVMNVSEDLMYLVCYKTVCNRISGSKCLKLPDPHIPSINLTTYPIEASGWKKSVRSCGELKPIVIFLSLLSCLSFLSRLSYGSGQSPVVMFRTEDSLHGGPADGDDLDDLDGFDGFTSPQLAEMKKAPAARAGIMLR